MSAVILYRELVPPRNSDLSIMGNKPCKCSAREEQYSFDMVPTEGKLGVAVRASPGGGGVMSDEL